jgi:hypothetical protein
MSEPELYHEIRGAGRPLVLLHGAMSTIETSFEEVMVDVSGPQVSPQRP